MGKISLFLLLDIGIWISCLVVSQPCCNYEGKTDIQNKVEQKDEKNKSWSFNDVIELVD